MELVQNEYKYLSFLVQFLSSSSAITTVGQPPFSCMQLVPVSKKINTAKQQREEEKNSRRCLAVLIFLETGTSCMQENGGWPTVVMADELDRN